MNVIIKILIVEDEVNSREGLTFLIRSKFPDSTVLEALDGVEGMEKATEHKPDIIITDIRMPRMDGIEMIRQLRIKGCNAQCIILSGYAEFHYAQEALTLKVSGYLLKPLVPATVLDLIEKCFEVIQAQEQPDIFHLGRDDIDLLSQKDTPLILRFYKGMDCQAYLIGQIFSSQMAPIKTNMKRLCDDNSHMLILNFPEKSFIGFIAPQDHSSEFLVQRIHGIVSRYPEAVCSYGFIHSLDSISEELDNVRKAVKWSISTGKNIVQKEEAARAADFQITGINAFKKNFQKLCLSNDYEKCLVLLLKYLHQLQGKGFHPEAIIQVAVSCLLQINGEKASTEQLSMCCVEAINNILSAFSFYEIESNLSHYFQCILSSYHNVPLFSKPVAAVIDEINQSFNRPLSLNSIADRLGITPQYLSRIFAKETGSNFIDYLTTVRIEKAKSIIKNSDYKIYEIAERVGYPDAKYFCTIFKKVVGMSPHQYKRIVSLHDLPSDFAYRGC